MQLNWLNLPRIEKYESIIDYNGHILKRNAESKQSQLTKTPNKFGQRKIHSHIQILPVHSILGIH